VQLDAFQIYLIFALLVLMLLFIVIRTR